MKIAAALLAAGLALSGCSMQVRSEPTETPTVTVTQEAVNIDDVYIDTLADSGLFDMSAPEEDYITLAKQICTMLDSGGEIERAWEIMANGGFSSEQAGYISGVGVAAYCPQHLDQIEGLTG